MSTRPALIGYLGRHPIGLVVLAVVLYSTGPVMAQASEVSGPVFSMWRLWFGTLVFVVLVAIEWRIRPQRPSRAGIKWTLWAGVAYAGHQLLFFTAIKATSVADVTLMNTLAPILVAVAAVPLFGERPGITFRLWSLVSIVGAAIVIHAGSSGPTGNLPGMLMALANVGFFTAFFLLAKVVRGMATVLQFLLGVMIVSSLSVTGFVMLTESPLQVPGSSDLWLAFAVAVLPGAIGHFAYTWPLSHLPANVPPLIRLSKPLIASLLAFALLGESIGWLHAVGGALAVTGVAGALLAPTGRAFLAGAEVDVGEVQGPHPVTPAP